MTMLVLSRKVGERIKVGENIWISIEEVDRGKVRVGIEAPKKIPILREELSDSALDEGPVETVWGRVEIG
jgi:carbon storage regulator